MHLPKKMTFVDVDHRINALDEGIRVVVPRRDAQEYDDPRRDYFQHQIKTLSDEMIRWQEIADDVDKLEHLYTYLYTKAQAESQLGDEAISQRLKAATVGTIPAAVLIFLAILTGNPWFIVLAVLAVGADAYAWWRWTEAIKETAKQAATGEKGIVAEVKRVEDRIKGLYRYAERVVADDEVDEEPVRV